MKTTYKLFENDKKLIEIGSGKLMAEVVEAVDNTEGYHDLKQFLIYEKTNQPLMLVRDINRMLECNKVSNVAVVSALNKLKEGLSKASRSATIVG